MHNFHTISIDAIFEKKKSTKKTTKKSKKDAYQMPKTEKDFLLPPDANVDISQLTRLFSRPNAVVRKRVAEDPVGKTVGFYDVEDNALGFDGGDGDDDFGGNDDGGFTFAYGEDDEDQAAGGGLGDDPDADYNTDNFDEVRKVEKIDIGYATVAKKVDVRRLKRDLWAELEEKTAWVAPEEEATSPEDKEEQDEDDIFEAEEGPKGEPQFVSFKETVEKLEPQQSSDVTVSFYFICLLHLANEKGLKLDSTCLEDFMISLDDGSAPEFGQMFGGGFTETVSKMSSSMAKSRGKREKTKKVSSYAEEEDAEEDAEIVVQEE